MRYSEFRYLLRTSLYTANVVLVVTITLFRKRRFALNENV